MGGVVDVQGEGLLCAKSQATYRRPIFSGRVVKTEKGVTERQLRSHIERKYCFSLARKAF